MDYWWWESLLNLAYELTSKYGLDIDIIAISKERVDKRVIVQKVAQVDIIWDKI